MLAATALQSVGRGMTLPFFVVYLTEVRQVPLSTAGLLMSLVSVIGLFVTGPAGTLTDRFGARWVLIVGTTAGILGPISLGFGTTMPWFVAGFALLGVSFGGTWATWNTLIATIVTGSLRQHFFGTNFALMNLGIGLGGVIAGLYVDVSRAATFTTILLADAAGMLVLLLVLLGPLRRLEGRPEPSPEPQPDGPAARGYLAVLREPTVLWLTAATFLITFAGYGQMGTGLPAWSRQVSEVSTRTLGFAFTANTVVIVALQFAVTRKVVGRRRTRVFVLMAAVWALAWGLLAASGRVPGTDMATVGVVAFMMIFGLGEIMMQSAVPAMVNDLADGASRGRANAINSGAFQLGTIVGPIVAGFLLQHRLHEAYISVMLIALVLFAVSALVAERRISPRVNGLEEAPGTHPRAGPFSSG